MNDSALYCLFFSAVPVFFVFFFAAKINKIFVSDSTFYSAGDDYVSCLRGLAAILVMIHHSVYMFNYLKYGVWSIFVGEGIFSGVSNKLLLLIAYSGSLPVMLFFMITGYLFSRKILKAPLNDLTIFFKARLKRLMPMYGFMVLMVIAVSGSIEFKEGVNAFSIIKEAARYFTFGVIEPKGLTASVSGFLIVSGVIWTLAYEWAFYFTLPILSHFTRSIKSSLITVVSFSCLLMLLLYINVIGEMTFSLLSCFVGGFLASLSRLLISDRMLILIKSKSFIFITVTFALLIIYMQKFNIYNPYIVIPLLMFFMSISNGSGNFRFLNTKTIKSAGSVSYSLYLMHGLCMVSVYHFFSGDLDYLAFASISMMTCAAVSCFTYFIIEKGQYRFLLVRSAI